MKAKRILCFVMLFLLCVQLVSCAAPSPEDPSVPAEESEVTPVPEDPNVRVLRAELEELFGREWTGGDKTAEWISPDRVETIRERVKQLKTPILTDEDVVCIAEQAVDLAIFLEQDLLRTMELPPCGVLEGITWASYSSRMITFDSLYTALITYTLYLFTPPDYVFREEEVTDRVSLTPALWLYLPLANPAAGDISRTEALSLLREGKNGVEVPLSGLADGVYPLDCVRSGTPVLLRESGEAVTLDLVEVAQRVNVMLPESVFVTRAYTYVREWLDRFSTVYGAYDGDLASDYELPNGVVLGLYQLISVEDAKEIREKADLLPEPVLTQEIVRELEYSMLEGLLFSPLLLLPGLDGKEDLLLPPGMDSIEQAIRWDDADIAVRSYGALAYLIDLFTPSAYRDTDASGFNTYYTLGDEEPLRVRITKTGSMYWVDGEGFMEPLYLPPVGPEGMLA